MKTIRILVLGTVCLTGALAYAGTADPNAMSQAVALQNQWRQEAGKGSLTWNQELADGAQTWAENIASRGVMEHASLQGWTAENISFGSTPEDAAALWYQEKQFFEGVKSQGADCDPEQTPMSDYMKCGHYANITGDYTEIGCGMSGEYLVCRYRRP